MLKNKAPYDLEALTARIEHHPRSQYPQHL